MYVTLEMSRTIKFVGPKEDKNGSKTSKSVDYSPRLWDPTSHRARTSMPVGCTLGIWEALWKQTRALEGKCDAIRSPFRA